MIECLPLLRVQALDGALGHGMDNSGSSNEGGCLAWVRLRMPRLQQIRAGAGIHPGEGDNFDVESYQMLWMLKGDECAHISN